MKPIITIIAVAAIAFAAVACTKKQAEQTPKSLVLYYSQTGVTKAVAEEIQRLTGADMALIEITEPYDGDFNATIERCLKEREEGIIPTLKPFSIQSVEGAQVTNRSIADYDIIYLGYPIWFGTYAPPVMALLKTEAFTSKTIIPFCTFGSGGLEASIRDLQKALPQAEIKNGYGVREARIDKMPAELDRFLKENGHVVGEVEPLPTFSEMQPVGEVEKAIFDIACGNYQFPLGTPVRYATREIEAGTEYKFDVDNQTIIYIIRTQTDDEITSEFTRVVR